MKAIETFRLAWSHPICLAMLLLIGVQALALVSVQGPSILALVVLETFVLVLIVTVFCVITVSPQGISLYRIHKLAWPDIVKANKISGLGLPALRLTDRNGRQLKVPLYFSGNRALLEAVIDFAPADSPVTDLRP